jgi:type IV pilus assembly protein PilF
MTPQKALLAAACLATVLAMGGCASSQQDSGQDDVAQGDESDARRRARIRMELAVGYYEEGRTEVALEELRQALAADPTLGEAHNLRGMIFMRLNDMRQADESFRRAIQINPRDPDSLHNYAWLQCQQARYDEANRTFEAAIAIPTYTGRARTLMAQGVCYARAGKPADAERTLTRAYELDATNPIVAYNLADLLLKRGDLERAKFYIRRLNNSELANAESLWLGIKVERRMNDRTAMLQLADVLRRRFPGSKERAAYDRGAFDE